MLGKMIAVELRKECSRTREWGEVARHRYLARAEALVGEVAKLLGGHCCYSSAAGVAALVVAAAGAAVVDFAGFAAGAVDAQD